MRFPVSPRSAAALCALLLLPGCASFRAVKVPLPLVGPSLEEALAQADEAERQRDRAAYNAALLEIVEIADERQREFARGPVTLDAPGGGGFSVPQFARGGAFAGYEIDPAQAYRIRGLRHRHVRDGIGVPVVVSSPEAETTRGKKQKEGAGAVFLGATAVLRREKGGARLEFVDPALEEELSWGEGSERLAADFSAPLGRFLDRRNPIVEGLVRMVRSDAYQDQMALRVFGRSDAKKTPVVFVHGLLSLSVAWAQMLNDLGADPAIARRFEFWAFSYPSGLPVSITADAFRQHLDLAFAGPGGESREIILVGHSMGGLVSRLIVTESGDRITRQIFGRPLAELPIPAESREFLRGILEFGSRGYVDRVVFLNTPHRGADLALSPVGKLGRSLIRLPGDLFQIGQDFFGDLVAILPGDYVSRRVPTSIDSLSPKNPLLLALDKLPIRPGVPYHSVIGDRGKGDTPNSSDGVVPYWSSHLEGAVSERIIPSGHGGLEHPQGIDEVRRILRLHAAEGGR